MLLLAVILLEVTAFAQRGNYPSFYKNKRRKASFFYGDPSPIVYGGLAIGQETFIATPRAGILGEFAIIRRNRNAKMWNFHRFSIYGGAEGSIFGLFVFGGSAAAVGGIKMSVFTLDINASVSGFALNDAKFGYSTYNPKLGLVLGPVWLKVGPSFQFNGNREPVWEDFVTQKGQAYNVEILVSLKLE